MYKVTEIFQECLKCGEAAVIASANRQGEYKFTCVACGHEEVEES